MSKVFEILNTQPNITKTKIFKIDLIFKNSVIKKDIKIAINCFDSKQVKQLSVLNNKRTKEISLSISSIRDSFETLYGILVYTMLSFPFFVSILYSALTLALPLPVV